MLIMLSVSLGTLPAGAEKKIGVDVKDAPGGSTTFGTYPPVLQIDGEAGQQLTTSIKIDNSSKVSSTFKLSIVGVLVQKDGLISKAVSQTPPENLARYIKLESDIVIVPPKSAKSVGITIDVPASAAGTQYATIVVSHATDDDLELEKYDRQGEFEKIVMLGMRPALATTIKLNILGKISYSYEIDQLNITAAKANQPMGATARVKNTGNGEIAMSPALIIIDPSTNKLVTRLKSSHRYSVYPGTTKNIEFEPPFITVAPGKYKAIFMLFDSKYKLAPIEKEIIIR